MDSDLSEAFFTKRNSFELMTGFGKTTKISYEDLIKEKFDLKKRSTISHSGEIKSVVLTPDGKYLITGSLDKSIKVWSIVSKSEEFSLFSTAKVLSLAINLDGNYLISGSDDGTVKIWSLEQRNYFILSGHSNYVSTVAISSDTKYIVSGSDDRTIKVWNFYERKEEFTLKGHSSSVISVCISLDTKYIISGSIDHTIRVWNIIEQKQEFVLRGHSTSVCSVAISLDSSYIVSGSDDMTIKIWDFNTKLEIFTLTGHSNSVKTVSFTPDQKFIISGSLDNSIKVWNIAQRTEEFTLTGHLDGINSIAINSEGTYIVSGSKDKNVKIWEIKNKIEYKLLSNHSNKVSTLAVSHDQKYIISGSADKTIRVWNFIRKTEEFCLIGHSEAIRSVSISLDGSHIISCSDDKKIKVWDFDKRKEVYTITGHFYPILDVAISSDKKFIASVSIDKTVKIWNFLEKKEEFTFIGHTDYVRSVDISPNSKYIVSGSDDKTIKVWDMDNREEYCTLEGHLNYVWSVIISSSGNYIISGSADQAIKIWNLIGKREEFSLMGHTNYVTSVCISSDEKYIVSSSTDKTIKIWNFSERREEFTVNECPSKLLSAVISPSGEYIAACSDDKNIYVWNFIDKSNQVMIATKSSVILQDQRYGLNLNEPYKKIENFTIYSKSFAGVNDILDSRNQDSKNFYRIIRAIFTDNYIDIPQNAGEFLFSIYRYTLIHYLCATGKHDLLKDIISTQQPLLRTDVFGKSPFYYSITNKHQNCTEKLISYLIFLSETNTEKYKKSLHAIINDFNLIVLNSSSNLHYLLREMLSPGDTVLSNLKIDMPIFNFREFSNPLITDFTLNLGSDIIQRNLILKSSFIPLPVNPGSPESIEFIQSIILCQNDKIYKTKLIQFYIKLEWDNLKYAIIFYTALTFINIIMSLLLVEYGSKSLIIFVPVTVINFLLFGWEMIQFKENGLEYFQSIFNIIDLLNFVLTFLWIVLDLIDISKSYITWFIVFLPLVRGLTGFKLFDGTRYYINLIYRSLNDMKYFLIIFFYSTFAFGALLSISKQESEADIVLMNFFSLWGNSYGLNFGNYDNEKIGQEFNMEYLVFLGATLINVVLILNLLISILGDSFDQFQSEKIILYYKEKADLILEFQKMPFWNNRNTGLKYLHYCGLASEEGIEDENLEKIIDDMSRKFDKSISSIENTEKTIEFNIQSLNSKISSIENKISINTNFLETEIQGKISLLEEKINSKITNIESNVESLHQKIEAILSIVSK